MDECSANITDWSFEQSLNILLAPMSYTENDKNTKFNLLKTWLVSKKHWFKVGTTMNSTFYNCCDSVWNGNALQWFKSFKDSTSNFSQLRIIWKVNWFEVDAKEKCCTSIDSSGLGKHDGFKLYSSVISLTPSTTMRWTALCGLDLALVGVNVNVTMVEGWLLFTVILHISCRYYSMICHNRPRKCMYQQVPPVLWLY